MNSISEQQTRYADDRYAQQRRAGFPWMRFMPDLEEEYRAGYMELRSTRIRAAGVVGVLGVLGFVFVDTVLGGSLVPAAGHSLLGLVAAPVVLLPVMATYLRRGAPHLQHVVFVCTLIITLTVLSVINMGRLTNPAFPYESLFLVMMYIYFVSGLAFYQAAFCGIVLTAAFILTNLSVRDPVSLLYEGYYLVLGAVIGMLGSYVLERELRVGFLLQRELEQLAILDSLTGLMNRRAFSTKLETIWRQARRNLCPVGVMVIDLDDFKKMNDTCGHPFGDAVLTHVAAVLRMAAMRPLDMAARYGGDEFVAVWYDVDGAWFAKLAEELPARFANMPDEPGAPPITVSGGAVLAWPRPGLEPRDAIKLADQLLYDVKRGKRGQIAHVVLRQDDLKVA